MHVVLKLRQIQQVWDADTGETEHLVIFESAQGHLITCMTDEAGVQGLLMASDVHQPEEDLPEAQPEEEMPQPAIRGTSPLFEPLTPKYQAEEPQHWDDEEAGIEQDSGDGIAWGSSDAVFGGEEEPVLPRELTSTQLRQEQIKERLRQRPGAVAKAKRQALLDRAAKIPMRRPASDDLGYPHGVPKKPQPAPQHHMPEDTDDDGVAQG
jgi:hypothetical protein